VRTDQQRAAFGIVEPLLAELVRADVVVIGVPMYNFGIPAVLKAWIDQVTFPRMSLAGRSFVIVNARGGSYVAGAPRAPYDYQERYLRDFLAGHMGVQDVTFVNSELTNALVDPVLGDFADKQRESHRLAVELVAKVAAVAP
jgi:FMN-dependent NADH-azoreductase